MWNGYHNGSIRSLHQVTRVPLSYHILFIAGTKAYTLKCSVIAPSLIFSNEAAPRQLLETRRLFVQTNFGATPQTRVTLQESHTYKLN